MGAFSEKLKKHLKDKRLIAIYEDTLDRSDKEKNKAKRRRKKGQ